ncbi:host attachment protein [bacterium]|nr:host attachment protein [bacterium]
MWILIANGSRAALYFRPLANGGLEPIDEWVYEPESGDGDRSREAARQDLHKFASQLVEGLEAWEPRMERLLLVAPPRMLGEMRPLLNRGVRTKVEGELAKDLTREPLQNLPFRLDKLLRG